MTRQQILRYAKRVLLSLRGLVRLLPILCCKDTINFYIYNHFFKIFIIFAVINISFQNETRIKTKEKHQFDKGF